MNYKKIYIDLILKAQSQNREKLKRDDENFVYYERHHFVPRCMGGDDSQENLVLLTAKEHFVAHKLLAFIYPEIGRLISALFMMSKMKTAFGRDYRIGAREYERYKIQYSLFTKGTRTGELNPMFGKTGELNPNYKNRGENSVLFEIPRSEEVRNKIRNALTGRSMTEEQKVKMRKPKSEEYKANSRKQRKGTFQKEENSMWGKNTERIL